MCYFAYAVIFFGLIHGHEATWYENTETHKHYYFSDAKVLWQNARDNCQSLGGYLTTLNDRVELDFLIHTHDNEEPYAHFIGLYRTCDNCSEWKWIQNNSTEVNFLSWDSAEYPKQEPLRYYVVVLIDTGLWRNVASYQDTNRYHVRRYICEVDDACYFPSNPCRNGGTCSTVNRIQYSCNCENTGYNGDKCEDDVNECTSNSHECQNGECVNSEGSYSCNCNNRFTGSRCQDDINECTSDSHGCQNGDCVNNEGSYRCDCHDGYTGDYCEQEIDKCASNPCGTGSCTGGVNQYTCDCSGTGFDGTNCQNDINECSDDRHHCQHGNCSNTVGSYECFCFGGYIGDLCDEDKDECESSHCVHGNCSNGANKYTCTCDTGYNGVNCSEDINECNIENICNHGYCNNNDGGFFCTCQSGYEGQTCDDDINECDNSSYCGSGECVNTDGSYSCVCPEGFTGHDCESDLDECLSRDACSNHGNCTNTIGSYNCSCEENYSGERCHPTKGPDNQREEEEREEDLTTLRKVLTAGIVTASVCVTVLIVFIIDNRVYHWRRSRKQMGEATAGDGSPQQNRSDNENASPDDVSTEVL